MKKNLKKVISAVIACALSVSSVVAFAATPSFTDVADTAAYAQAVQTLAALGIVKGYEDGSFKPDDNITRAEVTTMVVAGINATEQAQGMMGTTQFSDVQDEATKWASGYINVGVANKFISGFEDGTFKPAENVTYAQIISMLVRALGYEQYADYLGGWPNGYLSLGQTTGVSKNVAASANDVVTRGQVAQLIYNFLDTPIVETNGFSYTDSGAIRPNIEVQDGKNDTVYKTKLTENFDTYIIEGSVTATNKTDSGMDSDKVQFTVGKNRISNKYDIITDDINVYGTKIDAYIGDTDAANYLNTYATAYVELNDSDEWVLKHFIPSGKNKTVEFDLSLLDEDDCDMFGSAPYLRFFATNAATKSTKYSLNKSGVTVYVNGTEVTGFGTTEYDKYIKNNTSGKIELVDKYESGSAADGYYDILNITYYATAKVDTVSATTGKVSFAKATAGIGSSVTLDEEDSNLTFHIYKNGSEIKVSDLKQDDILTISYDVEQGFQTSHFYDVYVSSDVAEGKYTSYNTTDETVTIGGKAYEFTEGTFDNNIGGLTLADEYKLYLDAFGRIYDYETNVSAAKLAVFDKYTKSSADDYYRATLYTTEGVTKSYEVDNTKVTVDGKTGAALDAYLELKLYQDLNTNGSIDTAERTTANKTPIEDRVVSYKVNSSGRITSLEFESGNDSGLTAYKERSQAIGSVKIGDATKIIDATTYNDEDQQTSYLALASVSQLIDDIDYQAFGFGDKFSNGTYPMVLIVKGESAYTEDTRFAVVMEMPGQGDENGETIYTIEALYQGVKTTLKTLDEGDLDVYGLTGTKIDVTTLKKGDVIVFQSDANDFIKQIDVVFEGNKYVGDYTTNTIANLLVVGNNSGKIGIPADVGTYEPGKYKWTTKWVPDDKSEQTVQLVLGPIVEKKNGYFTIGQIANETTGIAYKDAQGNDQTYTGLYTNIDNDEKTTDGVLTIDITSETKVAVYDYYNAEKARLQEGTTGDIVATIVGDSNYLGNKNIIPWDLIKGADSSINFAFAKVVDGEATDVFVIKAK